MRDVELLAPVGSFEALKAAVQNGANAVYLGGKDFGARASANNFDRDELKEAVKYAHIRGVQVFVTTNTLRKENEIEEFKKLILSLGKSEVESQERLIDLTVENLKKLTVESKEDIKNKGNLYKKLITFSGICIGIILI